MVTYSFKQYGTFSKEYEITANSEEDARKMFSKMTNGEKEDFLVFDDYDVDDMDVEEVEANE